MLAYLYATLGVWVVTLLFLAFDIWAATVIHRAWVKMQMRPTDFTNGRKVLYFILAVLVSISIVSDAATLIGLLTALGQP